MYYLLHSLCILPSSELLNIDFRHGNMLLSAISFLEDLYYSIRILPRTHVTVLTHIQEGSELLEDKGEKIYLFALSVLPCA